MIHRINSVLYYGLYRDIREKNSRLFEFMSAETPGEVFQTFNSFVNKDYYEFLVEKRICIVEEFYKHLPGVDII